VTASDQVPPSLAAIGARVDVVLRELLSSERTRWAPLDRDLGVPFDEIERLVLAGGKRLRPAFCHWGHVAAGGDPGSDACARVGAAFEILHAFALFHDDVMDASETRRGEPTTHARATAQHVAQGWAGEARRFGEGVAILVGDLAHVYADALLDGVPDPVRTLWHEVRIEVNVGQYLDILASAQRDRRIERAERICRYKSAKYTIERPLHLGVLLARPEATSIDDPAVSGLLGTMSRYGLPLGDAFQLRDDVMGAFGDSATTGKPVGDDLREGKPTALLAISYERADARQRRVLELVGDPDLDDAGVREVQEVITATGALDTIESRIAELAAQALSALDDPTLDTAAVDELMALAHFVTNRRS
jgi:geranylgeranyl diphosphate synthase, type I